MELAPQILAVEIPANHKAALFAATESARVRYFQEWWGGLKVDGIYGEKTAAALDQRIAGEFPDEDTPRMEQAFRNAKYDEGYREQPMGSNGGPYVEGLRIKAKLPRLSPKKLAAWCGVAQTVWCNAAGIPVSSRGAPGIVRGIIALPRGREVDIEDIGDGFFGMALRKRGRGKHHVQIFRAFMVDGVLMIEHVGGNEKHAVRSETVKAKKFFRGVVQVATYD